MSALTFIDLDNDGDLDLMAGEQNGNFKYFQNTGTALAPAFAIVATNPFALTDIGDYAAPSFVDLDNDGDFDLMAGEKTGSFKYFQNTGTALAPAFAAVVSNPFSIAVSAIYNTTPAFIDLDLDGDFDFMAGNSSGDFLYFQNTGTVSAPVFAASVTNPFSITNIGFSSGLTFGDLDDDGDMDLMGGELGGNHKYFVNTCAAAALITPVAIVGSTVICPGSTNNYSIAPVAGATGYDWKNPVGWTGASSTNSIVLTAGATGGKVKITAKNSCRSRTVSQVITVGLPVIGATTNPTLICVGQSATLTPSGGVSYTWSPSVPVGGVISPTMNTTYTVTGTDASGCTNTKVITQMVSACTGINNLDGNDAVISMYPNPTTGFIYLDLNKEAQVTIKNAIGKIVLTETLESGKQNLNLSNQATGVYFIKVISEGRQQTMKLIKE